jgi:hypothetical protein
VSEQRAAASLPDYVPIDSEEEHAAREQDEIAAIDAVGDYEAEATVMMEDVPQDIVFKTLKVSCACVAVLVLRVGPCLMSCGTTIRVLFSRALPQQKKSRPRLCRWKGRRGGRRKLTHTANSVRFGR